MHLSVDNFKSIDHVSDIDIHALTVLAGVNSSGKSSLIQALLLLKQTLCISNNDILQLNGPYVYANNVMELMHNKKHGTMGLSLSLSRNELEDTELSRYFNESPEALEGLEVTVEFHITLEEVHVSKMRIEVKLSPQGLEFCQTPHTLLLTRRPRKRTYDIEYGEFKYRDVILDNYSFANFFPVFARKEVEVLDLTLSKRVRNTLGEVLGRIAYIAPLRVAPVLARTYQTDVVSTYVMPNGENTRYILDRMASEDPEGILLVKRWICERFHLAKDIDIVKESGKRYRIVVTTDKGIKVDLLHMGFGLSQILPIIVQGCIAPSNSLFIVEDPDVHMHPSIQASMADFFIYLWLHRRVNALIETHSDHFITRLRRRVAEKEIPAPDVHLIFVENEFGSSEYQTIPLSDTGRPEGSMPVGFMDSLDNDYRAIMKANRK